MKAFKIIVFCVIILIGIIGTYFNTGYRTYIGPNDITSLKTDGTLVFSPPGKSKQIQVALESHLTSNKTEVQNLASALKNAKHIMLETTASDNMDTQGRLKVKLYVDGVKL